MDDQVLHPAASGHHLPSFITGPGEIDVLMVLSAIFLVVFVFFLGVLYFRLHALPDRFALNRAQYEVVCVLSLLALVTQKYLFWIAALVLALIKLPNFSKDPISRIAGSIEKAAGLGEGASYSRRALEPKAGSLQNASCQRG
jgi:hypothetical protein